MQTIDSQSQPQSLLLLPASEASMHGFTAAAELLLPSAASALALDGSMGFGGDSALGGSSSSLRRSLSLGARDSSALTDVSIA